MMRFQEIVERLPSEPLMSVEGLPYPKVATGKVREIFDLGDRLLMVATDRISAFDVIMPNGVPGKGVVLTQLSRFWFSVTAPLMRDHLLPDQDRVITEELKLPEPMQLRSMVVRKLRPLPIECVARGYLAGSGWSSYRESGQVCGVSLPPGLREADPLPEPIFTPTTKAAAGHDEPIDEARARELVGDAVFEQVRDRSLAIYRLGLERAKTAGMILADTKFEFGTDEAGNLYLIDEVLTPDSSRYWEVSTWQPGGSPPSFDKQFVRDFLQTLDWNKQPPGPRLPDAVVRGTLERYLEALRRLLETS